MQLLLFVLVGALLQQALAGDVGDVVPNLRQCHEELICPTGSTCCPSGCAPGMYASCCSDKSACPSGYVCVSGAGCELVQDSSDDSSDDEDDDRPHTTARMKLCSPDPSVFTKAYGLQVSQEDDALLFPYFSSAGDLSSPLALTNVKSIAVMSHGYRYNYDADTHLCAAMAASGLDNFVSTVFVSTWFLRKDDDVSRVFPEGDSVILRWSSSDSWRYGANGWTAKGGNADVSSFECMDSLLERLVDRRNFPNLEQVTFVGDSYGADLVLRWSLLSSHAAWEDSEQSPHIRIVGTNPYSYVYLSPKRRPLDKVLEAKDILPGCPQYNSWEHGLGSEGKSVAYKDNAMAQLGGNITALAIRYAARDVTYVIGELDTDYIAWKEDIDDRSPECAGANQGLTRYDRLERYYESLTEVMDGKKVHRMLVSAGAGHDGPRMLQTSSGYEAVFGSSRVCTNPSSNTAGS